MNKKIVIIGGGAAGPKVAAKLKREVPNFQIELFTQEEIISYSACGFPYYIEDIITSIDKLIIRTVEDFRKEGINIHTKHRCTKINTKKKIIEIEDLNTKQRQVISYNILVIATGATPIIPRIKGVTLKNIYILRRVKNAIDIKAKIKTAKNITILGGGYICIELLEAFIKQGLNVTIIEKANQLLRMFDKDIEEEIEKYILSIYPKQINILKNEEIEEFIGNNNNEVYQIKTKSNKIINTDLVVLTTGVKPNTAFLKNTDIELGINDSIKVNKRMMTSNKSIYAVGDCCEKFNLVTNSSVWFPLGSTANKEGRCAAINISNRNCNFDGILQTTITKFFNFSIAIVGINYDEAIKYNFEPITTTITKRDRASYMPDSKFITIKLIVDKKTQRILGIQGIGEGNVAQRINAVIPLILDRTPIKKLINLDLPYSPPFSPSIDPIINALQIIYKNINK